MGSKRSTRSSHGRQNKSTQSASDSTSKTSYAEGSKTDGSKTEGSKTEGSDLEGSDAKGSKIEDSNTRDINEILQRLAQPSRFSEDAFEKFQQKNEDVIDESEEMRNALSTINHDLSLAARSVHQLRSYKPVFDNNAYTLGATDHASTGTVQMYDTHVTPTCPGGSPEYHMTQTGDHALTESRDQYLQGATALRDSRDTTMEWRNQFIPGAKERARYPEPLINDCGGSYTTSSHAAHEPQTSVEDLAAAPFATSFPNVAQEPDLSDITEEEEDFSIDEHALEMPPDPKWSKTLPSKEVEKTSPKASGYTSRRKHCSGK